MVFGKGITYMKTINTNVPGKGLIAGRYVNRSSATACLPLLTMLVVCLVFCGCARSGDKISPDAFISPPMEARPGAYWCWLNGYVDHERMTREMEEAKALGMRGFEIWDVGVLVEKDFVPHGPAFLGEESLKSIQHAMKEAKRLGLELNMIAASSWNAGGAWVKKSDGSKRLQSSSVNVTGPKVLDQVLPLPCDSETYYYDISVMAVPHSADKKLASLDLGIDLTGKMD